MKKANYIAVIIAAVLMVWGSVYCNAKDIMDTDGNDWMQASESWKLGFMHGFVTAIFGVINARASHNRVIDFFPEEVYYVNATTKAKETLYLTAFKFPVEEFEMYGIAVAQLYDGVQAFYKDYRNRNIELVNAVYIVRAEIRGEDPGYINAQTRWLKKPREERDKLIVDWGHKVATERRLAPYPKEYKAKNGKVYRLFDYAQ